MEDCDQGYGYIIYRTTVFIGARGAELLLPEVHDIAHIYIDGDYAETICRNQCDRTVKIEKSGNVLIDILVENMGRINYGIRLCDRKGLIGDITLHDIEYNVYTKAFGFDIYSLELSSPPQSICGQPEINAPAFYEYEFDADEISDTVLRPSGFTRGIAFINGINLGRHWDIEHSDNRLYIPSPFIKKGKNRIVIFDALENSKEKSVELSDN